MKLTEPPRMLLVHAHPDDESLWTGGTIARYAAAGVHVTVVTCTLGEEGEIITARLKHLVAAEADQLGGYRVGELWSACTALRLTEHRFLGGMGRWRDSGMIDTAANAHPRCFVVGDVDEQTGALREIVEQLRPQVVVSYDAFGGYGHPDHIRAHDITMAAATADLGVRRVFHTVHSARHTQRGVQRLREMAGLPFRLPADGELPVTDDGQIDTVVDIAAHVPAKLTALRAHATQVQVWQGTADEQAFALSNDIAQPVLDKEFYTLAAGPRDGCADDLFGGLW